MYLNNDSEDYSLYFNFGEKIILDLESDSFIQEIFSQGNENRTWDLSKQDYTWNLNVKSR